MGLAFGSGPIRAWASVYNLSLPGAMHDFRREGSTGFRPPAPSPRREKLGTLALIGALRRNPLEVWTEVHFREPIIFDRFALGRVALVNEPTAIRRILVENAINYRKSALQTRVLSLALRNGLLTVEGDQWRSQRRTLAPLFARRPVMRFTPIMRAAVEAVIERWRAEGPERPRDIGTEMNRLALDILARTCFSDGLGGDPEAMRVAMMTYFDVAGRVDPFDVLGIPAFVPRVTQWKARPMLRYFDHAVNAIIATRRRKLAEAPDEAPRDLLTALLAARDPDTGRPLSEVEAKANILTFIAAGQETTANALTWSLYLIASAPEWRARILAEAEAELDDDDEGLADRLTATRATLDEALRLYPPITATSRTASEGDELAGHKIGPGTMVVVAPYVLHRHRLLWDEPDIFDPSRFLAGARKIERGAYLPFGTGARMCLGASFAHQEATLVLASLVRRFDLRLASGQEVWPKVGITLRPRDPLLIHAIPRE
jgi:cytochrome P450